MSTIAEEKYTNISSLTSAYFSEVISLRPDYSPQWQKDALIALFHVAQLPKDWDSYESSSPHPQVIENAERLIRTIKFDDLPVPQITPVSGGGIQIEWGIFSRELELEILPDGSVDYLEVDNQKPLQEGKLNPADISQLRSIFLWLTNATSRKNR
jgi:hypothetical protein